MSVPFDKEKFLNSCSCGCSKGRQAILDGIEKYQASDPEMVKYLGWYRDRLWEEQVAEEQFRQLRVELGDEELNKRTAAALRAMADKLEEPGPHFMIHCQLPKMPIFSDKEFGAQIKVTMLAHPIGG